MTQATTPPRDGPKAYSYLRFSSPEQAKGASRKRQIEAAARWAAEHDLTLDEELRDEGISAFRGKHRAPTSALGGFLARVKSGEVAPGSFLLVESFDRLSREEVLDALELFLGLTKAGITVVTFADGRVYNRESLKSDQTQLIISIVIMTRAYDESATKSRRVADAWSRKRIAARESRQAMTATCPGWMRLVGGPRTGRYDLISERAAIIVEIFRAVIAGDGRRTITKRLNAAGVDTWGEGGNKGKLWHDSYVQKILESPAVFGRYDKGDDSIEGYFPAVVDEETYWRAKAATASRLTAKGKNGTKFNNILKGLVRCHECDGTMGYLDKGKRSTPTLRCVRAQAGAGCANTKPVPYDRLERAILFTYAHYADHATFAVERDARQAAADIDALEARRAEAGKRRERLLDVVEAGGPIPAVRARLDAIAAEIAGIDAELAPLRAVAADEAEAFDDIEDRIDVITALVNSGDTQARYQGRSTVNGRLRRFIEKIVVEPSGRPVLTLRPGFEDVDQHMLSIYGPAREALPDRDA